MTGDQGEPIQISDIHKHWWKIAVLCVCVCIVCVCTFKSEHLGLMLGVLCRQMYENAVCVSMLTDDERCWMIHITYGFLLDWLDSVIMARMNGGGEVLSHMGFASFGWKGFAELWKVNVGHWDCCVLFDLQHSTEFNFRSGVQSRLRWRGDLKREGRWEKSISVTVSGLLGIIKFSSFLVHLHNSLYTNAFFLPVCMHACINP